MKSKLNWYDLALKTIKEDLGQSRQWIETSLEIALDREHRAKALIEFLEVYNCGSVGGFDTIKKERQEDSGEYHNSLEGRYKWLLRRREERDL